MDYKEFFTTDNKSGWKCVETKLKRNNPDIYLMVINYSDGELNELPFNRKVWHFVNTIKLIPKCLECGGEVKYKNITLGYQDYCGVKCSNKSLVKNETTKKVLIEKYGVDCSLKIPDVIEKTIKSNIEKYGVDNPFKNKEVQDKIKEENIIKYGFNTPSKNKEIQDKIKETNLERYGHESHLSNTDVRNKIKKTNIEKIGVDNPFKTQESQEKAKNTILDKYGVRNVMELESTKDKIRITNLEKYGVEWYLMIKEIQDKIKETNLCRYGNEIAFKSQIFRTKFLEKTSKIESEICNIIGAEPKFVFNNREYDFKLNNDIFEIDGDFFHPDKLISLTIIQISSAINDIFKIKSIDDSSYSLYKIRVSDIKKLNEITVENLKEKRYLPDYSISYNQNIVTKEYFTHYIETKGVIKLAKYVPLLLKFVRVFQPEFPCPDKTNNLEPDEFNNNTSTIDIWNDDEKMLKIITYMVGINDLNETFDFSMRNLIKFLIICQKQI